MRYCPACKRKVGKKLTVGQVVVMITLWSMLIPGIIYTFTHAKKCPICGANTYELFEDKKAKADKKAAKKAKKAKKGK